jgi:protease-4
VELTKKSKPIVVSMGNYAASGGYIACNANTIFLHKHYYRFYRCFGILPNFSQLTTKLGIHTQQVKHMKILLYSPFVPLDDKV